ncbi:hypothetical protein K493DRAFT_18814 [Basidiobolus meristosporus CBS 931.73]|uniref:Uncharacterized protein n=1 Tax=Basidiobolus meristosporus CBS 931.73 TaxID=1314790 RepID=A0A1Y1YG64_9FUNG|nr:hypothetical protein K493DRAFT_18814 [Basidiobolus meristosporus CBS 931.73]|eukprot:ORX96614.1 hypothetical protein K493DRAFT_18814 [Basidiobolus meristosporus CBS 931.73]
MNRFVLLRWIFECAELPRAESSALVYNQFILPALVSAKRSVEIFQVQPGRAQDIASIQDYPSPSLLQEYQLLKSGFERKTTEKVEVVLGSETQDGTQLFPAHSTPIEDLQTASQVEEHTRHTITPIKSTKRVVDNKEQEIARRRELQKRLIKEHDTPKKKRKRLL